MTEEQLVVATEIAIRVEADSKAEGRVMATEGRVATDSNRLTVATRQDLQLRLSTVDRYKDLIMEGTEAKWEVVRDRTNLARSLLEISAKSIGTRQLKFCKLLD